MKKTLDTSIGIVEVANTGEKVKYFDGLKLMTRAAWKDNDGGIWVKQYNQYNRLGDRGRALMEMLYSEPYGREIK